MARTVLDIVQRVAAANRFQVPESLFSREPVALQALSLAEDIGEEIATHGMENGWPDLLRTVSVDLYPAATGLSAGQYSIPTDCHKIYACTLWDGGREWPIRNLPNPVRDWATLQNYPFTQYQWTRYWRVSNLNGQRVLEIYPAPVRPDDTSEMSEDMPATNPEPEFSLTTPRPQQQNDGDTSATTPQLTYSYLSKAWVRGANGVAKDSITADTDELQIPEQVFKLGLSARWLQKEDRDFSTELSMYEQERDKYLSDAHGARTIIMGGSERQPSHGLDAWITHTRLPNSIVWSP